MPGKRDFRGPAQPRFHSRSDTPMPMRKEQTRGIRISPDTDTYSGFEGLQEFPGLRCKTRMDK